MFLLVRDVLSPSRLKDFGDGRAGLGAVGCSEPLRSRLGVRIGWDHVRRVKAVTRNIVWHS